jgi:hypothetical protein
MNTPLWSPCVKGVLSALTTFFAKNPARLGYPVDVRSLVAHHTAIITTWVKPANVIARDGFERLLARSFEVTLAGR